MASHGESLPVVPTAHFRVGDKVDGKLWPGAFPSTGSGVERNSGLAELGANPSGSWTALCPRGVWTAQPGSPYGYHVVLETEEVVTVRSEQVRQA